MSSLNRSYKPVVLSIFILTNVYAIGTAFLTVPSNPHELALGGFTASVEGDPSLYHGNPALIVQSIPATKLFFGYNVWFSGTRGGSFLVTNPIPGIPQILQGTLAFGVRFLGITDLEFRTYTPTDDKLSLFGARGTAIEFSWGRRFDLPIILFGDTQVSRLNFGLTARWIRLETFTFNSSGAGFDIGIWLPLFKERLAVGASIQNLGIMSPMKEQSPELPMTILTGVTFQTSANHSQLKGNLGSFMTIGAEISKFHGAVFRIAGEMNYSGLRFTLGTRFSERVTSVAGGFGFVWRRIEIGYGLEIGSHQIGIPHLLDVRLTLP